MTTWATLRTEVRTHLSELTANKFSDAALLVYCADAIYEYSEHLPLTTSATPTAQATEGQYTVDGSWSLYAVSHVSDAGYEEILEKIDRQPGKSLHYWVKGWYVVGTTLYVKPTSLETITCYYQTTHTVPTEDTDEMTVPDKDLRLIKAFIIGTALDTLSHKTAYLDRWNESSARNKNPFERPAKNWRKQWEQAIGSRLANEDVQLFVKGRDYPDRVFAEDLWQTT